MTTIGFIGLGAMGMGMARSLLRAGFTVKGYDVVPAAVTAFVEAGGVGAASVADAAKDADLLVVMVLNAAQVESVLFGEDGAAAQLASGAVVMVCSTTPPAFARQTAQRLADLGLDMLDAPVSGGTVRAADGELSVMASGSPAAFAKAEDVLEAVAANVYRLGDECGQGSSMKMINQLLAGVHIASAAEAIAFAAKAGMDLQTVYDVICNSAGGSWMFQNRVPHILADDYTPHSAIDIWLKDLGIVLDTARDEKFPLPLTAAAYQLYLAASAQGWGRIDDAGVVKVYEMMGKIGIGDSFM
ncbi:MAG: NAD(P)-binding domain-containing protein [Caldilineaceae bacterium]